MILNRRTSRSSLASSTRRLNWTILRCATRDVASSLCLLSALSSRLFYPSCLKRFPKRRATIILLLVAKTWIQHFLAHLPKPLDQAPTCSRAQAALLIARAPYRTSKMTRQPVRVLVQDFHAAIPGCKIIKVALIIINKVASIMPVAMFWTRSLTPHRITLLISVVHPQLLPIGPNASKNVWASNVATWDKAHVL